MEAMMKKSSGPQEPETTQPPPGAQTAGLDAVVAVVAAARFGSPRVAMASLARCWPEASARVAMLEALRALDRGAWVAVVSAAYKVADDGAGASLVAVADALGYSRVRVRAHRAEAEIGALRARAGGRPKGEPKAG